MTALQVLENGWALQAWDWGPSAPLCLVGHPSHKRSQLVENGLLRGNPWRSLVFAIRFWWNFPDGYLMLFSFELARHPQFPNQKLGLQPNHWSDHPGKNRWGGADCARPEIDGNSTAEWDDPENSTQPFMPGLTTRTYKQATIRRIRYTNTTERTQSTDRTHELWRHIDIAITSSSYSYLYMYIFIQLPLASPPAIERWPQGSLMCILGGSPRESRRKKKEEEEEGEE